MIDIIKRPPWINALLVAAAVTLVFLAGWTINGWRLNAQIERIKGTHQADTARAALTAAARLSAAQKRNETIEAALAAARVEVAQQAQEKDDEIKRLTTGRRCLDAAAVSVLNRPASTSTSTGSVPPAGSEPLPGTARFATDTDVGLWARTAEAPTNPAAPTVPASVNSTKASNE